jgi:hypothetical protein
MSLSLFIASCCYSTDEANPPDSATPSSICHSDAAIDSGVVKYAPTAVDIWIDNAFPSKYQNLILDALNDWSANTQCGFGTGNISYVSNMDVNTEFNIIKFSNDTITETTKAPGEMVVGWTDWNSSTKDHPENHVQATVYISTTSGLTDDEFGTAARHEIMHAFNFEHFCTVDEAKQSYNVCQDIATENNQMSVMYPNVNDPNSATTVQAIDAERFCAQWPCKKQ